MTKERQVARELMGKKRWDFPRVVTKIVGRRRVRSPERAVGRVIGWFDGRSGRTRIMEVKSVKRHAMYVKLSVLSGIMVDPWEGTENTVMLSEDIFYVD